MKNLRSILFVFAVLLTAAAAQAQQTNVMAKVPFDFVVGDQVYSAGEYNLKSMLDSGVAIRVNNLEESTSGIVLSSACRRCGD